MWYRAGSDGRWYVPRFIFVCHLAEVKREADVNDSSVELGLALIDSQDGKSQIKIPKFLSQRSCSLMWCQ